ncbi:MAG: glycosyltransferase family 39 protein [Roseiflexaceae bacterium]
MVRHMSAGLGGGVRAIWRALFDHRLALALLLFAMLLTLAVQVPRSYTIEIGQEDDPGGDLPLVGGFYPPEQNDLGDYRWTSEQVFVDLPGMGQRSLDVEIRVFGLPPEVAQRGPQTLELWAGGALLATLPVRPEGAIYNVVLPPPPDGSGDQGFEVRSATIIPTGDERSVGSPFDRVTLGWVGLALPPWRSTLLWLLAAVLGWLGLRLAEFGPRAALAGLLPVLVLVALAAVLDPPRTALGAWPAVRALALGLLLVLVLRAGLPRLAGRLAVPLDARALRWLLLLVLLAFGLRYGGKIYPFSMPGDIGFHDNRMSEVIQGRVLLLSRNRGVDFPYPSALYLLLAPFTLSGIERRPLLHLAGAVFDGLSPLLVYTIAASTLGAFRRAAGWVRARSAALLAAGFYTLCAAGFMTTWWNFSTHIFAQFTHLLLITALVLFFRPQSEQPPSTEDNSEPNEPASTSGNSTLNTHNSTLAALAALQLLVYLGHFGFWMNTTLLLGLLLVWLALLARRGRVPWGKVWTLLWATVAAEAVTALLFYTGYTGLFLEQIRATSQGGLTGLAGREAVPAGILWQTLWDAGLRTHFGLFPVPLALAALALFGLRARAGAAGGPEAAPRSPVLFPLMLCTFLIGLGFAALPFLSGSTLSTRWLMFSAWAVAVGAAALARELWERGRPERLAIVLIGGYVLWITASQWLGALAWRVRPPEPF